MVVGCSHWTGTAFFQTDFGLPLEWCETDSRLPGFSGRKQLKLAEGVIETGDMSHGRVNREGFRHRQEVYWDAEGNDRYPFHTRRADSRSMNY